MATHTLEARAKISRALIGNKRGLGYKHTPEARAKISEALRKRAGKNHPWYGKTNELSHNWKGDSIGYRGMHMWIARNKGKAQECMLADDTRKGRFEWSNKSREYKRDFSDWQQLCTSHHKRYDLGELK